MSAFDTGKKTIVPGETPGQNDIGWLSYSGKPIWNNGAKFSTGATFDSLADVPAGVVGPVWVGGEQYFSDGEISLTKRSPSYYQEFIPAPMCQLDGTWVKNFGSGIMSFDTTLKLPDQPHGVRLSVPSDSSNTGITMPLPEALDLSSVADDDVFTFFWYSPAGKTSGQNNLINFGFWGPDNNNRFNAAFNMQNAIGMQQLSFKKSELSITGSPNWNSITAIRFSIDVNATLHREAVLLGIYIHKPPLRKPSVIVTLDDNWASDYNIAHPYCYARGVPLTLAVIPNDIGSADKLTAAQIHRMVRLGHAIIAHDSGEFNTKYTALGKNKQAFIAYLKELQNKIAIFDPTGAKFCAIPQGNIGGNSADMLAITESLDEVFLASRQIAKQLTMMQLPPLFPDFYSMQQIQSIIGIDSSTSANVIDAVDAAVSSGESSFLYAHDLTVSDRETKFKEIVDHIVTLRDAGTVDLLTMPEWYQRAIAVRDWYRV